MTVDQKNDDRYTVPGLARGLQLLMQFNRDERELSGAELSRRMGLPRASVFRMLFTLEQSGFLERCPDSVSYKLGLSVLRLGFELLASMELTEVGRPIIDELRDRSGFSAHLVVRHVPLDSSRCKATCSCYRIRPSFDVRFGSE